ncbi:MAG: ATP-binding cassette domain-containing protein [Lactobacillus sp.]|nr:ATP-binding cassette domain-containing protein [Lactobacillus sp.]
MSAIEFKHVDVTYKQNKESIVAVKDFSLDIEKGDIYGIIGFSGAGKSTIVRTINLLEKPSAGDLTVLDQPFVKDGKVVISNKDLRLARRKIGMVFQTFNLLDQKTVIENVAFALKHAKLPFEELEKRCYELLELVDLKDKAEYFPSQLSGGQKQRVAIARALANDPEILISDESTSALDPQTTKQILDLLKKLNRQLNLTIVLITHEMDAVKAISNKVAVMENGQIVEKGLLKDIALKPKAKLTREFVGRSMQVLSQLDLPDLAKDETLYQLVYSIDNVTKSIVVDLYQKLGIEASILDGNVELINDEAIGTLIVQLKGDEEKAVEFFKEQGVVATKLEWEA